MSLRHGVTAAEEHKLKGLISKGATWAEIVAKSQPQDEKGAPALLQDVDLAWVKEHIYEPLVKKLEAAKKANFKTIHDHEAAIKKAKDEAKKAAKEKNQE